VTHLASDTISAFVQENKDMLTAFGYPLDGSPGQTEKAEDRRKACLRFSKMDFHAMPITIESDFLGCNLVRYNERFIAVPMAAGPIAIDQLSLELLNELPTATTLWDLKILMLAGAVQTTQHSRSLDQLARALNNKIALDTVHSYWHNGERPRFIESHHDFRIVFFRGMYIGIHRTLNDRLFTKNWHSWVKSADSNKVMVSTSRQGLLADIDGLSTIQRGNKQSKEEWDEKVKRIIKALYSFRQRIELDEKKRIDEKNALEEKIQQLQSELDISNQRLNYAMDVINDGAITCLLKVSAWMKKWLKPKKVLNNLLNHLCNKKKPLL
jgi:hypothetical protein